MEKKKIIYPVYCCRTCGKSIIIKEEFNISTGPKKGGMYLKEGNKIHDCPKKPEDIEEGFEYYTILDLIGCVSKKEEREEVQNEIGDGAVNRGNQEGNGETDIDQ